MKAEHRHHYLGRLSSDRLRWLERTEKLDLYLRRVDVELRAKSDHPEESVWLELTKEMNEEKFPEQDCGK